MKMYDNSAEAIFFFNHDGKVISMNSAAELILDAEVLDRMAAGDVKAICMSCKGYTSETGTSDMPILLFGKSTRRF